jgi:hypothetical protein
MYFYDRQFSGYQSGSAERLRLGVWEHEGLGQVTTALPSPFSLETLKFQNGSFSTKLQSAFQQALHASLNNPAFNHLPDVRTVPIALIALDGGIPHPVAGQNMFEMFYSGSLLKVAAMYAAFQLRVAVNDLAATLNPTVIDTPAKLILKIGDTFNRQIQTSVPEIPNIHGVPKYTTIFQAANVGGTWKLEFDATRPENFATHLRRMIVGSHNESAGFCIRALGIRWINAVLQAAGFLNLNIKKSEGIWLAGDYENLPTVLIPSVNDDMVKQATTCIHMAWLFSLLHDKALVKNVVNPASGLTGNDEMLRLLELAVDDMAAQSLLKRVASSFTVLQSKIGVGDLKKSPQGGKVSCLVPDHGCVLSEASILRHPPSGRKFVTVWQNVLWDGPYSGVRRVADIIEKTMMNFAGM